MSAGLEMADVFRRHGDSYAEHMTVTSAGLLPARPIAGFDCMEVGAAGGVRCARNHFCGDRVMTERDRALLSRNACLSQPTGLFDEIGETRSETNS
jgi:hypothetical protein